MSRLQLLSSSLCLLVSLTTACSPGGARDDACQQAIDLVRECTGESVAYPAEGCVGEFAAQSDDILAGGCEGLADEKSDAWCHPSLHWLGFCGDESLEQVAALDGLNEVCPPSRQDELCLALIDAEDLAIDASIGGDALAARQALANALEAARRVAAEDPDAAPRDPAYRYLLRERAMGLLAYNVLSELGTREVEESFRVEAQTLISEHFPAYPEGSFPIALVDLPPESAERCVEPQGLLIFPGVVRLTDRDEFQQQADAIEAALPCFHTRRVETGSFVSPALNADQAELAAQAISDEFGAITLHTLGYSQGATNSLTTLVNKPTIAERVRTVMVMNSAAHGSEVADLGVSLLSPLTEGIESLCSELPLFASPLCDTAFNASARPDEWLLELIAMGMGVPLDSLEAFIEAEDGVSEAPDLRSFFERHLPGISSLSTEEAAVFWAERASELPQQALYYSFRSAISDTKANLPTSNSLFHSLLERAGERRPYNDMQVRLDNQSLGGPVAEMEIRSPVAEGNHWQWELATGAVPETVMPADMTDRIPHRELLVGYYQAVVELGLAQ